MGGASCQGREEVDIRVFVEDGEFGHAGRCGELRGIVELLAGTVMEWGLYEQDTVKASSERSSRGFCCINQIKGFQDEHGQVGV